MEQPAPSHRVDQTALHEPDAGPAPELDAEVCERARQARDARFDGRFFIGVETTGVYCRPICPVRPPKRENVRFYPSAAAAAAAGFRPCLRCRPESSPRAPVWRGTETTVARALRLIDEGWLDRDGVDELSARLGVGARHLGRLFQRHLGASPVQVAQTRRLHLAKKLLDETELSMTAIAEASGYGSLRRFNEAMRATYDRSPSALRKHRRAGRAPAALELRLSYRPPLDFDALLEFYANRAIPGVETVDAGVYRRTIAFAETHGSIGVRPLPGGRELELAVEFPEAAALASIVSRVRRLFDLDADPMTIERDLRRDPALEPSVAARPGLRVPGAWEGFELLVRAIVGQAITVAGARTILGRIVERCGARIDGAPPGQNRIFPPAQVLARADLTGLGLSAARAATIRRLAAAVAEARLELEAPRDLGAIVGELRAYEGVGPWTAEYVALRACAHPDAFPAGDLGLCRGAERAFGLERGSLTARALERRSQVWRPWRAYAAQHLWAAYVTRR
jgi:AraC family transcriptional regulator, regulatory protein of adaptative response / DNA-3-methyladenine glycosylase II